MSGLLSIIIVNYKTPLLLIDCLESVYSQSDCLPFEIIVVDNHSNDNSEQLIKDRFRSVRWISMDYNAGFARANNEGIRQSAGDVVLLLNSDTIVVGNAVDNCFRSFIASKHVACGVQLLNADQSPQISGNYFMRGGLNNLLSLPVAGKCIKWIGDLLKVRKPHVADTSSEVRVDWINGAFLMVRKTAIATSGLMDEDFFLYAEEAEWCYRLGKAGSLVIFGQWKVVHLQGETSNAAYRSSGKGYYNLYDRKGLQIMLSNFVRIRKQFGAGWFFFHLLVYSFTVLIYFVYEFFESISGGKHGEEASPVKFAQNVRRLWRFVPTILRNRPFFYKVL